MNPTLNRGERIFLTVAVSIGAAAFVWYLGMNVVALSHPPTSDNPMLGAVSTSELRSQFGQLGDFLNPILTGISLTFLALSYRGQQREWRAARLFSMSQAYDKAIDELSMPGTEVTGRAALQSWVNDTIEGLATDPSRHQTISDAELGSLRRFVDMRIAMFHRPFLLLAQVVNAAGMNDADVDDSTSILIRAMTHQELLLFTMMAARPGNDPGLLRARLHTRLAELGLQDLSARIVALNATVGAGRASS